MQSTFRNIRPSFDQNLDWIEDCVALDVINPSDPDGAARQGYENYKYMRREGLRPIPVWHVGESRDWLFRYLTMAYDGSVYLHPPSLAVDRLMTGMLSLLGLTSSMRTDFPFAKPMRSVKAALSHFCVSLFIALTRLHGYTLHNVVGTIQFGDYGGSRRLSFRNDGVASRAQPDIARLSGREHEQMVATLRNAGISERLLVNGIRKSDLSGVVLRAPNTTSAYKTE